MAPPPGTDTPTRLTPIPCVVAPSSAAMSLYRKLGANSRSQAVARSRELALLDE